MSSPSRTKTPPVKRRSNVRGLRGTNVRDLRKKLSLTQHQLADRLGASTATVARWEENRARPTAASAAKLERLRRVVDELEDTIMEEDIPMWVVSPHPALRNHAPIDVLDNDFGFEAVLSLIESIRSGVYS